MQERPNDVESVMSKTMFFPPSTMSSMCTMSTMKYNALSRWFEKPTATTIADYL